MGLVLEVQIKPEIRAAADKELPPDHAPFEFGLLPRTDEYVITSGAFKGQRGFFTRDERGAVVGLDLAGRLFNRITTVFQPRVPFAESLRCRRPQQDSRVGSAEVIKCARIH